jgi:hypothetical protein
MGELPKKNIKNEQLREIELWSSFFYPSLVMILSDNERNIRMRWPDKVALEKRQGRPDAIISQVNGQFSASLGFGECKLNKCSNASLCKDIIKLTQLAQRSININHIKSVLCFQIYGTYAMTT